MSMFHALGGLQRRNYWDLACILQELECPLVVPHNLANKSSARPGEAKAWRPTQGSGGLEAIFQCSRAPKLQQNRFLS